MYIIGENIHIISDKVKEALSNRDARFFQELAVKQVEAGASALDLNLGPRKKDGEEVFPCIVETVETVVDVPLSFDSTNILGIEAGLKKVTKAQPIINSTSAEPERLEKVPLVAKHYNTRLIALTMGASGIPVAADERVNIALEKLIPRMMEIDFPIQDLIIDPLVLTVSGCQEYGPVQPRCHAPLRGDAAPYHVLPLGVDPDHFNPAIRGVPNPNGDFVFLANFEWSERKAPQLLLTVFNQTFRASERALLVCKVLNRGRAVDVAGQVRALA